ncbi:sensor histidine kinase [Deinococcus arboris]
MTLRWRLTLFYTALLTFLLTAVGIITLYVMRVSLIGSIDRDLNSTYEQFVPVAPRLPLDSQVNPLDEAKLATRYSFSNYSLAVEELTFYSQQSLLDELAAANTPQQKDQLFLSIDALRQATRRSLAVDTQRPIELSQAELERLINSPDGRLTLNRSVAVAANVQPTLMRLLVLLVPFQAPELTVGEPAKLQDPATAVGLRLVYVGRNLSTVQHLLDQLKNVMLLLFGVGLVTAGTGAYALAGQALQPLRRVQRAAERIGGQNLTDRVPVPTTGDEVESLARALNAMLGRLEGSFEAQRRFTSDASHELRTPVTAISGHAGYLLRRTNPTGQQAESLRIIQSESARLTNLIASLLQLARSDSGALVLSRQPILAALFLSDITRELAPLAQAQQTTLTAVGEDVTFEGDPDRLKQVMINLVSNALKAGAQTITLRSAQVAGEVRLSVQDNGPGIPADQLERLFDRFYRLEDSRSRDQGGAGLGLSIARGIVDAHGGRIWLESESGQGTTAHVQLPIGNVPVLDEDDVP